MTDTTEQLEKMLADATPGPWAVFEYDAGDKDEWTNCPSIQAAPEYDCAIIHWDGFKQKYWQSARGQKEIDGNAALIAAAPTLAADLIAARKRIAELEGENDSLKSAMDEAEQACEDRADRLNDFGPESECCAATAKNCASDIANIKATLEAKL